MKHSFYLLVIFSLIVSCKEKAKTDATSNQSTGTTTADTPTLATETIKELAACSNDSIGKKVAHFLVNDYLKDDLKLIEDTTNLKQERTFQCYPIDLNGDGKQEVFVSFTGPYFCGSGGCTYLVLNSNCDKLIQTWTVTREPFYVEPTLVNGWRRIIACCTHPNGENVAFEAHGKKGKGKYVYPSNPSLVAPYKGEVDKAAEVIFDTNLGTCKQYHF